MLAYFIFAVIIAIPVWETEHTVGFEPSSPQMQLLWILVIRFIFIVETDKVCLLLLQRGISQIEFKGERDEWKNVDLMRLAVLIQIFEEKFLIW